MNTAEDYYVAYRLTKTRLQQAQDAYLAAIEAGNPNAADMAQMEVQRLDLRAARLRRKAWLLTWWPFLVVAALALIAISAVIVVWR